QSGNGIGHPREMIASERDPVVATFFQRWVVPGFGDPASLEADRRNLALVAFGVFQRVKAGTRGIPCKPAIHFHRSVGALEDARDASAGEASGYGKAFAFEPAFES